MTQMTWVEDPIELEADGSERRRVSARVQATVTILMAVIGVVAGAWFQGAAGGDLDTARILLNLPRDPGAGPRIGQPAPDFTLRELRGQPVTLSELRGRPVLILSIITGTAVAVLAGLLETIPFFGPLLAAIGPFTLALAQRPIQALIVTVFFIAVQQIEDKALVPRWSPGCSRIPPAYTP